MGKVTHLDHHQFQKLHRFGSLRHLTSQLAGGLARHQVRDRLDSRGPPWLLLSEEAVAIGLKIHF